ncbi:MAG: Bro-N domain-containing protein [Oscillospiraceae bacterium]|nr:Bro-N domain-containing protein [Oscillospiraceae bacterium]
MIKQELILFDDPDFKDVRVVQADGKPWFVGKDVCRFFGDKNHSRSLLRVNEADKAILDLETKGGIQKTTLVNESGLYALLLGMHPQKANKRGVSQATQERIEKLTAFRHWVTHDVLPTVRHGGKYETPAYRNYMDARIAELMEDYRRRKGLRSEVIHADYEVIDV